MEMQKIPQAGFQIRGLWIAGLQRKISLQNLMFPFNGFMESKKIIKSLIQMWLSAPVVLPADRY
jgi:UDP-N-acetylglucosamine--N-acetylmuramyl-(pentapeptide) pyrophosphoryl-undecaprenol N-acetylglucosamine transferase